jgi:acetate kinase
MSLTHKARSSRSGASKGFDHAAAAREIIETGRTLLESGSDVAFGHRVAHGGVKYESRMRVTETVLNDLVNLEPLAPLHQPQQLRQHQKKGDSVFVSI